MEKEIKHEDIVEQNTTHSDDVASESNDEVHEQPVVLPEPKVTERKTVGGIDVVLDKSKSVKDQAKDLVEVASTAKAVEDEQLVNDLTELKKKELLEGAQSNVKEEQAKGAHAEKNLQDANYGVYSGIADLIGLKKPLPNATLKALMVILQPILVVYYVIVGFITGVINITMDCINAITERFVDFTKNAKRVIIAAFIVALLVIVWLVIYWLLRKYGVIAW